MGNPEEHSELKVLIPEYVAGSLDESLSQRVSLHLSTCEECRQLAADSRLVRDGLQAPYPTGIQDHIPTETLVVLAENPESLDHAFRMSAEVHLSSCVSCLNEFNTLQAVDVELGGEASTEVTSPPYEHKSTLQEVFSFRFLPYLAACLIAGAGLTLVFESFIANDETGVSPPSVHVGTPTIIYPGVRGFRDIPVVARTPGNGEISLLLPRDQVPATPVKLSLVDWDGSIRLPLAELLESPESAYIQIEFGTATLADGRYAVEATSQDNRDPSDSLNISFPFILQTAENGKN